MDDIELQVLIIDDEITGVKAFSSKARKKLISLDHYRNFEDGIKQLDKNFQNYDGVILDAKCFADKEAETNEILSEDHIDKVSNQVKILTETKGYIPFCIYTGYSGKFRTRLEVQEFEVFAKPQEGDEVLDFIRDHNELERKYFFENEEVMKIFKYGVLSPKYLKRLGKVLNRIDSSDISDIKETASVTRDIIEDLFDLLVKFKIVPIEIRDSSVNTIAIYLTGKRNDSSGDRINSKYVFDEYIGRAISFLHTITSHYLHSNGSLNSSYTNRTMIYTLFELLIWFKNNTVQNLNDN